MVRISRPVSVLFALLTSIGLASGCKDAGEGDDEAEPNPNGTGTVVGGGNVVGTRYPVYVGAVAIASRVGAAAALAAEDSGFRNRSVASGSPAEMTITVTSMRLASEGNPVGIPIFLSDEGKMLKVRSGYVDLTELFTTIACLDGNNKPVTLAAGETCECGLDASGKPIAKVTVDPVTGEQFAAPSCPSVEEGVTPPVAATAVDQLGTFTKLTVRLKAKAQIRGCVTGHFQYSVTDAGDDAVHTFCTQTAKSVYASGADAFANADFEAIDGGKVPEVMDIPLDSTASDFATKEFVDLTFPIAGGVTIDGVKPPQITLGIDLGRALRFRGLFAGHPREAGFFLTKGSYFFALPPQSYQFVFVGRPGKVFGHSWTALAGIRDAAADVPTDRACVDEAEDGGCHRLAGWMTTIFQGDGTPIAFNILPDDDDAFTVLKGSNFSANGFDTSIFTKIGTDTYDIAYMLGGTAPTLSGTLFGMSYAGAAGSTHETTFATKTMTNGKFAFGSLRISRNL